MGVKDLQRWQSEAIQGISLEGPAPPATAIAEAIYFLGNLGDFG